MYCGDFFALTLEQLGTIDVVYDRAALVALPQDMRKQYSQRLCSLTPGAKQLLVTFEYDQSLIGGPPFAIPSEEIQQNYSKYCTISLLHSEALEGGLKGKVPAVENLWSLTSKG